MIGPYIRQRRATLGISIAELERRLSTAGYTVSRQAISHWERERNLPPLHIAHFRAALALALDMDAATMLQDMGYPIQLDELSRDARLAAQLMEAMSAAQRPLALAILRLILEYK